MKIFNIRRVVLVLLLGCSFYNAIYGQDVKVDGMFNEEIWNDAKSFSGFKTLYPAIGKEVSEITEVKVCQDSLFMYFAIICKDVNPELIHANLSQRDQLQNDDSFTIEIDLNGSGNSNLFFRVNPFGIQEDGVISLSEDEDLSQDKIWYSKGMITKDGYQVEVAIPFQSLRFKWKPEVTFNIGFRRSIFRKSEQAVFPEYDPNISNRLLQREAILFSGIKKLRVFNLIPSITYTNHRSFDKGAWSQVINKVDVGVSAKIGVSSDLVVDLTINPDFSQVESDAGQIDINLRNPLYFSEKRPFFQEGTEMFKFGAQDFYKSPVNSLVHTRNIIDPIYGIKLSGKMSDKMSIASIISTDAKEMDDDHFQIVRVKHQFKDDGYLGVLYTGKESRGIHNRVGGIDGKIRLNGQHRLEYNVFRSNTRVDSQDVKSGNSIGLFYEFNNNIHKLKIGFYHTDKNFESQVGYVNRNGVQVLPISYNVVIPLNNNLVKKLSFWNYAHFRKDLFYKTHEYWVFSGAQLSLRNESWIRFGNILSEENYLGREFKNGKVMGIYSFQVSKQMSFSGRISYGNKIYYDPNQPYQGYGLNISQSVSYAPTNQINIKLSGSLSSFYKEETKQQIYNYKILRLYSTYQLNKHLYVRAVGEYNFYNEKMNTEVLISFTYIPGTVMQLGYNLRAERHLENDYEERNPNLQINNKVLFFKASYVF